jgi:hypothetical protein
MAIDQAKHNAKSSEAIINFFGMNESNRIYWKLLDSLVVTY